MSTTIKREASTQAQAASMIRKELKAAFPYTKFSVTSEGYSGGDSVHINWTDGPTVAQVEAITAKYQYGSFDGMIDLYEYTNRRDDLPQTRYVMENRRHSKESLADVVRWLNQFWGYALEIHAEGTWIDPASDRPLGNGGGWQSQEIHRTFYQKSLVCPECKQATGFLDTYCGECGAKLMEVE